MSSTPPTSSPREPQSRLPLWLGLAAIVLLVAVLVIGKFSGLFDPEDIGRQLGETIRGFADGPFGVPALVLAFCLCAYIAVPQFILIGVAVYAFGPAYGALYSWIATLCSGGLTYWVGRVSGQAVLARVTSKRLDRFSNFVSRNAFLASAIVRNVTAGPFVFVNTVFGALKASFPAYIAGMALGIIPKIALIAFAGKGLMAALEGNALLAAAMVVAAFAVLAAGWEYSKRRRNKGENIALSGDDPVDTDA